MPVPEGYEPAGWAYDETEWWHVAVICQRCGAIVLRVDLHDTWHAHTRRDTDE